MTGDGKIVGTQKGLQVGHELLIEEQTAKDRAFGFDTGREGFEWVTRVREEGHGIRGRRHNSSPAFGKIS
jgi:hypothetical protein